MQMNVDMNTYFQQLVLFKRFKKKIRKMAQVDKFMSSLKVVKLFKILNF